MSVPKSSAAPLPSSTVVILRDRPGGIEVFMVVRHHAIDFASGALVFPGGKLEPGDADPAWEMLTAPSAPEERAYLVAAARETFEEAGLLIARRIGEGEFVDADATHELVERFRADGTGSKSLFRDLVSSEGLSLATEMLVPYAHWITPPVLPKRFDTRFYLVAAPVEQLGSHDGGESVDGLWISPQQALDECAAGKRTIVFATQMNLRKLTPYKTVAEAVAAIRAMPVVTVMPDVSVTPAGRTLRIPAEAGYGITEFVLPPGGA